jgi:hypothetical protein
VEFQGFAGRKNFASVARVQDKEYEN